jgi:hypothetical protein
VEDDGVMVFFCSGVGAGMGLGQPTLRVHHSVGQSSTP